jgi:hypothetical protein
MFPMDFFFFFPFNGKSFNRYSKIEFFEIIIETIIKVDLSKWKKKTYDNWLRKNESWVVLGMLYVNGLNINIILWSCLMYF